MRVAMPVIMSFMAVIVAVAVVSVSKGSEAHDVNKEAQYTDYEEFVKPLELVTFHKPFSGVEDNFYADEPA
jgi:hypothetical protein